MSHTAPGRALRGRRFPLAGCLGLLALTSCAIPTTDGFDARQATFIGRSEGEVVAALGVPERVHEADGRRFLQYEERRVIGYGGGGYPYGGGFYGGGFGRFGYGAGLGGFGGGLGPVVETRACDLTFELRGGRVIGFNRRGNDCVAPSPVASAAPAAPVGPA